MNEENMGLEIAKETIREIATDVYEDAGRPIAKPIGELVGLVPRAIKAALFPLEKWILTRENSLEETKKLLAIKLKNDAPDNIESPEPFVAVPALQYISYCMDNNELRDMYANLLANSMRKVVRNGVHPAFVEIIKQLCPDEAKILKYLYNKNAIPVVSVRCCNKSGGGFELLKNFTNVGEIVDCEEYLKTNKYFDNLSRLGILEINPPNTTLLNKKLYKEIKEHTMITTLVKNIENNDSEFNIPVLKEGYLCLTDFGKSFCEVCVDDSDLFVQQ